MSQIQLEKSKEKLIKEIKKVSREEMIEKTIKIPPKLTLWGRIKIVFGYGKKR